MVGVPGRSKACQTCKRRKIKCDLQQPRCGQCTTGMYRCSSSSGFIFVPNKSGSHKTVYDKSLNRTTSGSNTSTSIVTTIASASVPPQQYGQARSLYAATTPMMLPKTVSFCALNRMQLLSGASSRGKLTPFPSEKESSVVDEASALYAWAAKFTEFCGSAKDMTSSPLACYTAYLGRRDSDQQLLAASRQLYTQGLLDVQRALLNSEAALKDETLAACFSLIMYEALECPASDANGYYWHNEGCLKLIKMRGSRRHQDGFGHDLFLEFRLHGAADALRLHRPNYLSNQSWLTLPWQTQRKSLFHKLVDIFLLGPAVLEKADTFPTASPAEILPLISSIADDLWTIDIKLDEFYTELEAQHPGIPLFTEQHPTSSSSSVSGTTIIDPEQTTSPPPSPPPHWLLHPLTFPTLETARTLSLFWAIRAMVWNGLAALSSATLEMGIPSRLPPIHHRAQFLDPVRRILQSVEYWRSETALAYGPARIALSLTIVVDLMEGKAEEECGVERRWAKRYQREIGDNMLRLVKFSTRDSC